jgi:hypothetical protein
VLLWDAGNWQHVGGHGVSRREVDEAYAGGLWALFPDPQGRPDQRRLIAYSPLRDRIITVAVERRDTPDGSRWRPITAYPSDGADLARWQAWRKRQQQQRRTRHSG